MQRLPSAAPISYHIPDHPSKNDGDPVVALFADDARRARPTSHRRSGELARLLAEPAGHHFIADSPE
jgi:hypothetical protein